MSLKNTWQDSQKMSQDAIPHWKKYWPIHFDYYLKNTVCKEYDSEYQKLDLGDWIANFSDFPSLNIEVKTYDYEKSYAKHKSWNKILLETISNVEANKTSVLMKSKADILAYGFYSRVQDKLTVVNLYWLQDLLEYIKPRIHEYFAWQEGTWDQERTRISYHAENIAVPMEELEPFICQLPYR